MAWPNGLDDRGATLNQQANKSDRPTKDGSRASESTHRRLGRACLEPPRPEATSRLLSSRRECAADLAERAGQGANLAAQRSS